MNRVFILSPASCRGRRADLVFRREARFDLAVRLRSPSGASLGEVFSFLSGLYFRGKLAYANAFARAPAGIDGVLVITPNRGLRPAREIVHLSTLRSFGRVPILLAEPRYTRPLVRDARVVAAQVGADCEVVLLGSVATDKYVSILSEAFGPRLKFPGDFVGRGDMSRGGLMLRCVEESRELAYIAIEGAPRHGPTPPRLPPRPRVGSPRVDARGDES